MKLYSTKEFSERAGVSVRTLKRWRKAGKLIPVKIVKGDKFYSEEQLTGVTKYFRVTKFDTPKVTTKVTNSEKNELSPVTNSFFGGDKFDDEKKVVTPAEVVTPNLSPPETEDTKMEKKEVQNKNTPTGGAESTFNADSTTNENNFQQKIWETPHEIQKQNRFFKVNAKKEPLIKDWSNPKNQKTFQILEGLKGFDCSGHGTATDYMFLDFDHVLKTDGTFINSAAEKFVEEILNDLGGYCEKSISGTGLHMFAVPTEEYADTLKPMAGGRNARFYFTAERDKENAAFLEIFYKTAARYCLLTGDCYNCEPRAEITHGKRADNVLKYILERISEQIAEEKSQAQTDNKKPVKNNNSAINLKKFTDNNDPKNFKENRAEIFSETDRAMAMIEKIDVSQLPYSDWLAFMSACKNIGIAYSIVDAKNSTDAARYNEAENQKHWDSITDTSFDIATLHGIAKRFGYSEKDFQREKYAEQETPEYHEPEPVNEKTDSNKKSDSKKLSHEEKFALFSLPHTDLYNAKRLVIWYGKYIRYLTDSGRWYTYSGKKKIWLDGGRESAAILPFAHELSHIITLNADDSESDGTDEKLAKKWQTRKTLSNAIELAKGFSSIRITEQDLNTHKNLLNCKNGVVDLQTEKLYPHDSKLLLTQCVNAEYIPNCTDETVEKFFRDVLPDDETREFFFDFLGYCLTGEIREEKALFIYGRGGNGKGTATKMLLTLMGDYACGFPIEAILMQPRIKDADTATPAFAKLQWCRLAFAEEIPAGRKLDYAKFKILTGGDALPIRKLYQDATEIKDPTHKMIFSGNHLPELDDTHDPGILRRWLQITFGQDFNGINRDEKLKQKLTTPNALSALLNILVTRAGKWYEKGLLVPEKVDRAKENYFAANDFVEEFINEFCDRGDGLSVKRKFFLEKLRSEYPRETNGKSDNQLTSLVCRIKGVTYYRPNGIRHFHGIRWKDQY